MVSMDRQIAQCLADYIIANPRDAAALIDACSRITEVHADGTPVRKAVSPSDFSGREWCALVDVANLLNSRVQPADRS